MMMSMMMMADSNTGVCSSEKQTASPSFKIGGDNSDEEEEASVIDPSYRRKLLKGFSIENVQDYGSFEAKVLVLYTGGTIGMKCHNGVYSPEPNFFIQELKKLPMFHNAEYKPKSKYASEIQSDHDAPLVMPVSKEGKHIVYTVLEYEPLLDSCNMTMDDYSRIARDIKKNYDKFDGFVILHGTDTMAYTASALSFMLESLGKPVILTGSQIPIFETRSDGRDNFLGALMLAGHYCIREVTIYFNNKLMRGNRCTKVDNSSLDAFNSPNMSPLVTLGIGIHVDWQSVLRHSSLGRFHISTNLCPNVGLLRLFPSITAATVRAFFRPPIQGVVIQTYGAGNVPHSRKDLMEVFAEATKNGIIIINITQCARGYVSAQYETGKALLDVGTIPGSDMTPEAALTKLSYVLGKDIPLKEKRQMMEMNLRGEMKQMNTPGSYGEVVNLTLIDKVAEAMNLTSVEEVTTLRQAIVPSMMCAAAKSGDIATMEKLLESGGSVMMSDYDGRTPLHVASSEGHRHVVQFLLQKGSLVHARDRFQNSPIWNAIMFRHQDVVRLLHQAGGHLTMSPMRLGQELCCIAAEDNTAMLECMKLVGVNLQQCDYDGRTALHIAAARGHMRTVMFLVENKASINLMDKFNTTPISEARRNKNVDVERYLLSATSVNKI
ncbi:L-asparaginase-like [Tubulanus polymorphus]|uniref:L-asparaginase-like n=1 Tax=Tubulanus polymorphus TaxID=672921 RepID=UPI003DA3D9A4